MMRRVSVLMILLATAGTLHAADWPLHRGDAARSGYTPDPLSANVSLLWKREAVHAPSPAWPRDMRMEFDRANHVVVASGLLFFGSSVEGKVTALDAASGREKWSYYTQGPVRFAPAVWRDRLFVASDDGDLHCLSIADGSLIRKYRSAPESDWVLGNGRIVGRRPVRGGPVILNDILYFAAGIWQSEQIFITAIDLTTDRELWTNDSSGGIVMPQPHGGAVARSGVSAQGYLAVDAEQLYVPTGRAIPAVFDRAGGAFKFYHLQANGKRGGTETAVSGRFFYNSGYAYDIADGEARTTLGAGSVAVSSEGVIHGDATRLRGLRQIEKEGKDRRGEPIVIPDHEVVWTISDVPAHVSLIVAGETAVAGGKSTVSLVDLKSQKLVSTLPVDGLPYGLAAADGRLYVTTDKGTIYCYAPPTGASPQTIVAERDAAPYGENSRAAALAEEIVRKSGKTAGYCVDLGCGDGALAYELAKRTDLHIVAIDSNADQVAAARRKLDAAGVYGDRVSVLLGDPSQTLIPKYVADLVVSSRALTPGGEPVSEAEVSRLQRPYGGVACLGTAGGLEVSVRGPLEKAGEWTHLYSNPANTCSSLDEVKGPLRVLWFRDVDQQLPQRHGRGPSQLFYEGRLFAEGMDELRSVDAYNGRTLWTFDLPGALAAYDADHLMGVSGTGSNFCVADGSVYVRKDDRCYRLDAESGKVLGTFPVPQENAEKKLRWGYIACEEGILYGSISNTDHVVRHAWRQADDKMPELSTESHSLFAMDAKSGKLLWKYDAKHSIRNNAIAIGDGRVFLIDRPLAKEDLLSNFLARRGEPEKKDEQQPTGELVVLNARTGEQQWTNNEDIFGTMLVFSQQYDMLLMSYQPTRFKLPSEVGGRMAVFRATDGYRAWEKKMNYVTRPLVNDRTIITQSGAWDLLTGDDEPFEFQRSYGCGQIAASKHLLLFRSATLGYKDLSRDAGTENFGGVRPGCWINALPVGGLVLVPDASAGCTCSYQNRSWLALQGAE